MDISVLPRAVRAELRGLSPEGAEAVAAHLVAAGQLLDVDPVLAYRHAEAARRRASRLPVVREAAAEAAYAVGEFGQALQGFRALRRMTGDDDYLPVIADCERALGRPQDALQLVREAANLRLTPDTRLELTLVEAGARGDLGQHSEALRILRDAAKAPVRGSSRTAHARLAYALADAFLTGGDEQRARNWFDRAADLDPEGATDAVNRRDALDGVVVEFDYGEDLDDNSDVETDEGDAAIVAPNATTDDVDVATVLAEADNVDGHPDEVEGRDGSSGEER